MGPQTMLVVDLESRSIHREELPGKLVLDFLDGLLKRRRDEDDSWFHTR